MGTLKIARWGLTALIYLFLAACGGGGGGDDGGVVGTGLDEISGTAAMGKPLADAEVTVKDRAGKKQFTKTDANGKYTINVSGMAEPYLVKVDAKDHDNARFFYAIAATSGVTNLHALSDLSARNWFSVHGRNIDEAFDNGNEITSPPTASELVEISGALRTLLRIAYSQFGVDSGFDFDHTPFSADGSTFDGLLDNLHVIIEKNKITIKLRDPKTGLEGYIVIGFDLSENLATSDTLAPTIPTGLAGIPSSTNGIVVVWNSSKDNIGVAGYNVYRDGVKVATSPYPVFSDTGLTLSTQYCYTIEAFDGKDNTSVLTAPVCTTTLGATDNTSPKAPFNLSAKPIGTRSLVLAWLPSPDNDVLGYDVFRGPAGAVTLKIATTVASGFTDSGLSSGTQYCYKTQAFDAALNRSILSDETCVTTPPDPSADSTAPASSANPAGGTFTAAQNVTLSCDDGSGSGCAAIYYTLDGSEPANLSPVYTQAIKIGASSTLRFFAVDQAGNVESPTHSASYVISDSSAPVNTTTPNFVNSAAVNTNSLALTLGLAATDNIAVTAYFINATVNAATASVLPQPNTPGWITVAPKSSYAANVSYTFSNTVVNGDTLYIHVWFKDAAGNVSGEMTDSIVYSIPVVDSSAPINTTTTNFINSGAANTNSTNVTLSLAATDNVGVSAYFAVTTTTASVPATPAPGATGWQPVTTATSYSGSPSYTLTGTPASGDTLYVHVWFKDAVGNVSQVASDSVVYVPVIGNAPPVANAGSGQTVKTGKQVTLNGGASSDADGDNLSFTWTINYQPAGSTASLIDPTSAQPRFVPDRDGVYEFALTVSDGANTSNPSVTTVTANAATTNRAPIAKAGIAQVFDVPGQVSLKGYDSSDADGDTLTYRWSFVSIPLGSKATITNSTLVEATFNTDVTGNYVAALVVNDGKVNSAPAYVSKGLIVSGGELEPNNTRTQATPINRIGWGSPVKAIYEGTKTDDWYRFEATRGMTYVIELFNVAAALAPNVNDGNSIGTACDPVTARYGLYLSVEDVDGIAITKQCQPNGVGNGHSQVQFTANAGGTYYIKVGHNLATTTRNGDYSLRILPKHNDGLAAWDATQEPNNAAVNAYLLQAGLANAFTSTIETRLTTTYSTVGSDLDWYRFEATAGMTYVIELFNVMATLAPNVNDGNSIGTACDPVIARYGLYLSVQDVDGVVVTKQCQPNGLGNTHNQVQFTANAGGTYYINVGHNLATTTRSGDYSIRILPKHNDPVAAWDANQEPNDAAANAYLLKAGLANALTGTFLPRSSSYSTVSADVDWYRFSATQGTTYVIELFNVAATLAPNINDGNSIGTACDPVIARFGLYVQVQDGNGAVVAKQCQPNGVGNTFSQTQFTPTASGTYYIKVAHNLATTSRTGDYGIRILPHHNDPAAAWDAMQEPNNTAANAYLLQAGLANAFTGTIEARSSSYNTVSADVDWYRFQTTAGVTYVLELFNVAATLAPNVNDGNSIGTDCDPVTARFGLYLQVQDGNGAMVAKQCQPNGVGNTLSQTQFTATVNGTYYIKVAHNLATTSRSGDYGIRILPKHDSPAAAWDTAQEPNNTAANAYLLQAGLASAVSGSIGARSSAYNTVSADLDWYRFDATTGVTYVIELFNVSALLAPNVNDGNSIGNACDSATNNYGLFLKIFDSSETELARQCSSNGSTAGSVVLTYLAAASGVHYIKVAHNLATTSRNGTYSIRITTQ